MGMAMYRYPSPKLQKLSRFLADIGADLVITQHSHCPGTIENYHGKTLIYGQGNFFYAGKSKNPLWRLGFAVQLKLTGNGEYDIDLIPIRQAVSPPYVTLLHYQEKQEFLKEMEDMSSKVLDEEFIRNSWLQLCLRNESEYMSIVAGHGRFRRKLNSLLSISRLFYTKRAYRFLLNIMRSETHREALQTILQEKLSEDRE